MGLMTMNLLWLRPHRRRLLCKLADQYQTTIIDLVGRDGMWFATFECGVEVVWDSTTTTWIEL